MADQEAKGSKNQSKAPEKQKPTVGGKPETPPETWKPRVPNSIVHIKSW